MSSHLSRIAHCVHKLTRKPHVLRRFHDQLKKYDAVVSEAYSTAQEAVRAKPVLRKRKAGPPARGWTWICTGRRSREIGYWMPFSLDDKLGVLTAGGGTLASLTYGDDVPPPTPDERLTLAHVLLALIHDRPEFAFDRITDGVSPKNLSWEEQIVLHKHCLERLGESKQGRRVISGCLDDVDPSGSWRAILKVRKVAERTERSAVPASIPSTTPPSDDAMLAPSSLAGLFGITVEIARKRLDRWRKHNGQGWIENPDRAAREPKYMYCLGAVRHVLARKKRRAGETSSKASSETSSKASSETSSKRPAR